MSIKERLFEILRQSDKIVGVGFQYMDVEETNCGGYVTIYSTEGCTEVYKIEEEVVALYNTDETIEAGDDDYVLVTNYPRPMYTDSSATIKFERGVDF